MKKIYFFHTPFGIVTLEKDSKIIFDMKTLLVSIKGNSSEIGFVFDTKENLILFVDEFNFCLRSLYSDDILEKSFNTTAIIDSFNNHFGGEI
jgi:hypothetical protein